MKNIVGAIILMCLFFSCKSEQLLIKHTANYDLEKATEDSVLNVLRHTNDLVLIFVDEKFEWSRTSSYYILAKNKKKWIGILYGKKNALIRGSGNLFTPVSYDSFGVSQKNCDSVFQYFKAHEIWKIKGDDPEHGSICDATIKDAENWRLIIFTQKNYTDAGYFAAEFYQQHCPNDERKIFIEAVKKIKVVFDKAMDLSISK